MRDRRAGLLDNLRRFSKGFRDAAGQGYEDDRRAVGMALEEQGRDVSNAPQVELRGSTYPLSYRIRDEIDSRMPEGRVKKVVQSIPGFGAPDESYRQARRDIGIGLPDDPMERKGAWAGTAVNDVVGDRSRSWWWYLNNMQAAGDAVFDQTLKGAVPELFQDHAFKNSKTGRIYSFDKRRGDEAFAAASDEGLLNADRDYMPKRGVNFRHVSLKSAPRGQRVAPASEMDQEFVAEQLQDLGLIFRITSKASHGLGSCAGKGSRTTFRTTLRTTNTKVLGA